GEEHRHLSFPAAQRLLTEFPGLVCGRRGPGNRHWIRVFEINPSAVAQSADVLADLGSLLRTRLFPIGGEGNGDTLLAVDEYGRVFALDQAGEWFIGDDIDAALVNLITGGPAARIRDDGTW
ncbi:MAG TPA: SUKH-3 domain-containing protein, partial [Pilimelia sp.]|nr:SUKH-3 domain-containing protein [Pilimelia sp.]